MRCLILLLSLMFNSFLSCNENERAIDEHALKQPPFGQVIEFIPKMESIKKPTYQELGIQPRVIYAQDDLRGNGSITDVFALEHTCSYFKCH